MASLLKMMKTNVFQYTLLPTSSRSASPTRNDQLWGKHSRSGTAICSTLVILFLLTLFVHRKPSDSRAVDLGLLDDIHNSTLGFQKIFVIGMPSRTDKKDALVLAAASSGLDLEFVDGVDGDDVIEKALPPTKGNVAKGALGAWRAHANILRKVVRFNMTSALILESDADWNVGVKDHFTSFAKSIHALTQPLVDASNATERNYTYPFIADPKIEPTEITFDNLPNTVAPKVNPYGDNWDILQPGHCGVQSPLGVPADFQERGASLPKGYVLQHNDSTVPEPHYLTTYSNNVFAPFTQAEEGVNHTRITHHTLHFLCTQGYAVSQMGARRLLHYIAVRGLDAPFDVMMANYCDLPELADDRGACLTTQPPLIGQYRAAGRMDKDSAIAASGAAIREQGFSENLRVSVRANLRNLVYGKELMDLHPDTVDESPISDTT